MDKNAFAPTPPMGWNSYDCYDTAATEAQVRSNAEVLAKRLLPFGWEYVVVDIQWYARRPNARRDIYQYLPFGELSLDEYARLTPDPERFPSSAGGRETVPGSSASPPGGPQAASRASGRQRAGRNRFFNGIISFP